ASVVPDVIDPQAVDRHHVGAPVRAVEGKPVLLGLLKLGTHPLPGQRLGRLPVALRQHQLLRDRHGSAPGRGWVGSTASAADSPAVTAIPGPPAITTADLTGGVRPVPPRPTPRPA